MIFIETRLMDHKASTLRTSSAVFFSVTDVGRNGWWRYILGAVLVKTVVLVAGIVISALMAHHFAGDVSEFVASNLDFVLLILGTWMLHVFWHRRPWRTLITTRQSISWRRIFQGAAVWGVIMLCSVGIQSVLFPERYVWTFDAQRWLLFFMLALLLTPIQCAAEEVFFRGYLLQAFGRISRHPVVAASLSSVMFTLPHLANPEVTANGMWIMVVTYFAMGLFFALVALRDARLELSIGAHTANNFFLMVFFGYKDSPLPASALFTTQAYDPVFSLVSVVVSSLVFYAWFFRRT
jgi:membrane protease YdiL (CAAX protease family)